MNKEKDIPPATSDSGDSARPLVINAMLHPALAGDFDRSLDRICRGAGAPPVLRRVHALRAGEDLTGFSHLILSGSEASAAEDRAWNGPLEAVTRRAVDAGLPVLGICYGHQFLARTLLGRDHVRRAAVPEFGWIRPSLRPNPLFEGMEDPLVMVSHFDEVHGLTADFQILGGSPDCPVHAFQYRDRPVWGVQFHPEYGPAEADAIFRALAAEFPELSARIRDERDPRRPPAAHDRLFWNFLAARRRDAGTDSRSISCPHPL
jgi:GMP synthase (glutamine-hydrolysing)